MKTNTNNNTVCPFCREDIKAEATKCKHCGSAVKKEAPDHGGTCPYCMEDIKPEAIKCKHCQSTLFSDGAGCNCHGEVSQGLPSARFDAKTMDLSSHSLAAFSGQDGPPNTLYGKNLRISPARAKTECHWYGLGCMQCRTCTTQRICVDGISGWCWELTECGDWVDHGCRSDLIPWDKFF